MKKGINAWAKELKHNEGFAKKYEGVKTVQDIISVAKKQGYDISKKDLQDLDLDAVAGGLTSRVKFSIGAAVTNVSTNVSAIVTGDHSSADVSGVEQTVIAETKM